MLLAEVFKVVKYIELNKKWRSVISCVRHFCYTLLILLLFKKTILILGRPVLWKEDGFF